MKLTAGTPLTLDELAYVAALEQRVEALDAADRRAAVAEAALVELLTFVVSELDRIPAPWPAYFADAQHIALVQRLADDHDPGHPTAGVTST